MYLNLMIVEVSSIDPIDTLIDGGGRRSPAVTDSDVSLFPRCTTALNLLTSYSYFMFNQK